MTASGLASATQMINVTPFMTIAVDQSAVIQPLIVMRREAGSRVEQGILKTFLTEEDDPVLAQLWDNDDDAIFDNM